MCCNNGTVLKTISTYSWFSGSWMDITLLKKIYNCKPFFQMLIIHAVQKLLNTSNIQASTLVNQLMAN